MPGTGSTRIADIVVPSVYVPYITEQSIYKNALVLSGISIPDPKLNILARTGGKLINMPFWQELSGDDEVIGTGTGATDSEVTVDNLTTSKDVACLFMRQKAWGVEDIVEAVSGARDPMRAMADKVFDYWNQKEQALLIKVLHGVFKDNTLNDSSDLVHDVGLATRASAATTANLIGAKVIISGAAKLGDQLSSIAAIAMHSTPYTRLLKKDLIDFIPDSQGELTIPTYLGKRLLVDDTCPSTNTGATYGGRYDTYLFGYGAIGRGEGMPKVPMETYRKALSGLDVFIYRRHFILHPRGIKFANASVAGQSPTNAESAMASNWDRVYQKKNIKLVKIVTNG